MPVVLLCIRLSPKQFVSTLNASSYLIEFLTRWFDLPIGVNLEGVSLEAGEDMHMDMKHFLKCRFPVGKKEVDAFALPRPGTQGVSRAVRKQSSRYTW